VKRSNLKAVPTERPEPMDWYLIDKLACALANDLMDSPETVKALMLLLQEIARHPYEPHVTEGIANHLNMRLFSTMVESDAAFGELMERERGKLA
jgi:hypothetical protein